MTTASMTSVARSMTPPQSMGQAAQQMTTARSMTRADQQLSKPQGMGKDQFSRGQNQIVQKPMSNAQQNRALREAADHMAKNDQQLQSALLGFKVQQLVGSGKGAADLAGKVGKAQQHLPPKTPQIGPGPEAGPYWYMMN